MKYHIPVLLQEVINILDPGQGKFFIDATVGGGGHTLELLKRGAKVLAIDRDPEAIEHVKKLQIGKGLHLVRANFSHIKRVAEEADFSAVDGILFDLGVSSHQFEKAERGFSFMRSGPLDMRMDPDISIRALDLINNLGERRLYEIFKTYGQEKLSRSIARAICSARQIEAIETTDKLARIIEEAVRRGGRGVLKIHPATKVFQALRIVVNSELLNLEDALPQTVDILKIGGRLAVISFHSLEDKIVKRFFKQEKRLQVLTQKPIGPTIDEILKNPRARSAKLRAAQKI